ncbi:CYTH and CHAD domain-containing protein [Streptomyces zagrosensis]|uniref:CHAD domain-containing protein n=1 Tax=Streptomyces zagrosensis TaxID=1042984 RepID=A0A7W9Q9B5_9ACTN|nr:CYTH and CHAD domain-containing protein [Streptomyces zagrosensis]MBB5934882.1 CHAD domain-containing protein [Streptomyces zagrosensis]
MVQTVREIERKYEAEDGAEPIGLTELSALSELPGVASATDQGTVALDATYYDTADQRLAADGVTLRRRTGGSDEGWHLKLPVRPKGTPRTGAGDDVVRDEVRAPLADSAPADLVALVRSRTRGAPLVPLVRLRTERAAWHLRDGGGHLLVEISIDRVTAQPPAGEGARSARWTEVEVELAPGQDAALLDTIEQHLTALGLRAARSRSKLARALDETGSRPGEHAPLTDARREEQRKTDPKSAKKARQRKGADALFGGGDTAAEPTAADVVLDYVRRQIAAIVALDPAVRLDTPDAVHKMRVATRRLRSVFRSYRRVIDRSATDPVGAELKWLAGELSANRDREVLAARLGAGLDTVPGPLLLGPVQARLRIWSHAEHAHSRERLLAALDGDRYLALLAALDAFRVHPPATAAGMPLLRSGAAKPPGGVLRKAVFKDCDRLAARVAAALALPAGAERDGALHGARKAAKRARYAAEAAELGLGRAAKELAARVQEVQQVLGDHQDSVVARAALRDIAAQANVAGESTFTFGLLYGREEAAAAALERELPGVCARVTDPGPAGPI